MSKFKKALCCVPVYLMVCVFVVLVCQKIGEDLGPILGGIAFGTAFIGSIALAGWGLAHEHE